MTNSQNNLKPTLLGNKLLTCKVGDDELGFFQSVDAPFVVHMTEN